METRKNSRPVITSIYDLVLDSNTSRWAISWQAWAVLVPAGILITVNSYSSFARVLGFQTLYVAGLIGVLSAGLVLLIAHLTTHRHRRHRRISSWVTATVYISAGSARSLAVLYYLESALPEGTQLPSPWLLAILGGIHGGFWLSFVGVTFMLAERHRTQKAKVEKLKAEIDSVRGFSEESLATDIEEVQKMISSRLHPVIDRVETQLRQINQTRGNLVELAEELRETCEQDVRGLSHRLAKPVEQSFLDAPQTTVVSWREVLREGFRDLDTYIYSVLGLASYLLFFLVLAQNHFYLIGPVAILMVQIFAVAVVLDLVFWRGRVWQNRKLQFAFVCFSLVTASYVLVFLNSEIRSDPDFLLLILIDIPISYGFIWLATSMLRGFQNVEEQSSRDIRTLTSVLNRIQLSVTRQRNSSRKILASLLHGKVQGRLAAVSLALVSAKTSGGSSSENYLDEATRQLKLVKSELNSIMSMEGELALSEVSTKLSPAELSIAAQEWSGLLNVDLVYNELDFEIINQLEMRDAILTGLRESLANALRHGHARNVSASIEVIDGVLIMQLVNDGKPIELDSVIDGHGGSEITSTGGQRSFDVVDQKTVVKIEWQLLTSVVK